MSNTYLVTLRVDKGWLDWLTTVTDVALEDDETLFWVSLIEEN